jgi:hypothetical protein
MMSTVETNTSVAEYDQMSMDGTFRDVVQPAKPQVQFASVVDEVSPDESKKLLSFADNDSAFS